MGARTMGRRGVWQGLVMCCLGGVVIRSGVAADQPYQTGFKQWRSGLDAFRDWQHQGTRVDPQGLVVIDEQQVQQEITRLDLITSAPDQPQDPAKDTDPTGTRYWVGEAISPEVPVGFGFQGALPSWNVETPPGTWIETQLRIRSQGQWTRWYSLGVWARDDSTLRRQSIPDQQDEDGQVYVDLVVLKEKPTGGQAYQVKTRLFSLTPQISPQLHSLAVAVSTVPQDPQRLQPGDPQLWERVLALPECSQMVYPDGGEVWCSPTSVAMVLGYWRGDLTSACEPQVRSAVQGVFDWVYDGYGNWPFNTAYAATQGLESVVARFTSLAELEPWIGAGVPVVFSFAWQQGELQGAAIPDSDGHLAVLVGFDAQGDPVVHDPAAATDSEVKRTYDRAQLETLWLKYTGGTVYLIYPPDWSIPRLS